MKKKDSVEVEKIVPVKKIKMGKRKKHKENEDHDLVPKKSPKIEKKLKMGKRKKQKENEDHDLVPKKSPKIEKKLKKSIKVKKATSPEVQSKEAATKKSLKFSESGKKRDPTNPKSIKPKKLPFKSKNDGKRSETEKIEDWNKYKKEKKELRMKRIKARTKDNFDRIQQAKKMGEKVRLKTLKEDERNKVINQLHSLLKGHYDKFVLAHDTARIVQWLLKYSSKILVHQISQELIPVTVNMLQAKYGIYCVKRLLKYGQEDIRTLIIDQMMGHAVKLVCHSVSAPVFEYAFSTFATPKQKQFLVQEFYGDLYKNSKDPGVKHIRDVYKDDETMKVGILGACKSNIKKVLNKSLLDSDLVQTALCQFLQECSAADRAELITELAPHIVVISNSKDGTKAAMQCIWHGTTKDKKVIMKPLKEHLVDLSKHEFGHRTIVTLLDSVDDTVLLHKTIISELLKNAKDLAISEWGRKVLLWLVAPENPTVFHPNFVKELTEGRESSNSKKSAETRRKEILSYSIPTLLNLIVEDTKFWLSTASLAVEMITIVKAGEGNVLEEALSKIVETVTDLEWKIQDGDKEVSGMEDAGIHMSLKKLAQHDKVALESGKLTFGKCLVDSLTDEVIKRWLKINRGCFLLVVVFEHGNEDAQKLLKSKLKPHLKLLKSQTTSGAKILCKKM